MQVLVDSMASGLEKLNNGSHCSSDGCNDDVEEIDQRVSAQKEAAELYDTNLQAAHEREAVLQRKLKNFNSCQSMVRSKSKS